MMDILKLAEQFEKLATKGEKTSLQKGDIQNTLEKKGLWGGTDGGFNPNSKTANKVFKILDKYAPEEGAFKVSCSILVPKDMKVQIVKVKAPKHAKEIEKDLNRVFGPSMSSAVKGLMKKFDAPASDLTLGWLSGVGY